MIYFGTTLTWKKGKPSRQDRQSLSGLVDSSTPYRTTAIVQVPPSVFEEKYHHRDQESKKHFFIVRTAKFALETRRPEGENSQPNRIDHFAIFDFFMKLDSPQVVAAL